MRETINQHAQELSATPPQAWALLIFLGALCAMIIHTKYQKDKEAGND